jgi:hypothetical protein
MAGADPPGSEGFLARWSRRKRAARDGPDPPPAEPAEPAPPAQPEPAPVAAPEAEAEPFDPASLPRLEDLTPTTDITAFLRKGVPLPLRNAALRRMWSLDPAIRDFIGPVDYGWDWNTPGGVPDFVDGIGEGPQVRALVERLLSPPPAGPAAPRDRRPEGAEDAVEAAKVARLEPPDPAGGGPPGEPPPAAAEEPAPAADTTRPDEPGEAPASPPPGPRHGGAMPV